MSPRPLILAAALCASVLCSWTLGASVASAEESEWDKNARTITIIGALTSTSTTVYFLQGLSDRILDRIFKDVAVYMRENAVALQRDVSLGAGPTIEDLVAILDLEPGQLASVALKLRQHRRALVAILSQDWIQEQDARVVVALLAGEPR